MTLTGATADAPGTVTEAELARFIGAVAEPPRVARYTVSEAMIRNWVEALDDENPVYTDPAAARATGRAGIIAPPSMISTWVMAGYRRWRAVQRARAAGTAEATAYAEMLQLLDAAGYTSVVATQMEQHFEQELTVGLHVTCHYTIDSVVGPKQTGLGEGYFLTLGKRYVDAQNELIATEAFTMLRFHPKEES